MTIIRRNGDRLWAGWVIRAPWGMEGTTQRYTPDRRRTHNRFPDSLSPCTRVYVRRMRSNRSIPASTVVPVLVYPDVRAAVAWLAEAFGFAERVRVREDHRPQLAGGGRALDRPARGRRRTPPAADG